MALGAYQSEVGRGNVLSALAHPAVVNPLAAIQGAAQTAGAITDLRTHQFALQQAQLQPVYSAMRMLQATNPDPTEDQFNGALGAAARNGGNVDGTVANYTAWKALNPNGKPGDFLRGVALGGMSPYEQAQYSYPQRQTVDTGAGTVTGTSGALAGPAPGQFQPSGFVAHTLTPEQWATPTQVYDPATQTYTTQPFGKAYGYPAPAGLGGGNGGPPAGSGGGPAAQPAGPPPGSSVAPGTPLSQKDADLARFAQRESGNQNILSRVPVPQGYTQDQGGSGFYQIIPSTWAEGQQLAGIPPAQQTKMAMQASPQQQYAVASALYDKYGGKPWAQSASQGQGGAAPAQPGAPGGPQNGAFIGATSAQPVTGPGANVQPAGGMQYFDPMGRPIAPGGGGAPGGGPGRVLPAPAPGTIQSLEASAAASTQRQQQLEAQMNAAVTTRATLEGMETELGKLPSTGVATGALSTLKNLLVQSGALSQQELDRQSQGLAAQEQFDKFSSLLNQQLLSGMGGQATDARQELTGAATPSSVHSTLGNLGIIHMLEGNLIATQVMGREFRSAMNTGQVTPAQFDAWRDSFTKPGPNGARFDPRVFWLASMGPQEQQSYVNSLNAKDRAQLLKNSNYAEQKGWVYENQDHTMGTGY